MLSNGRGIVRDIVIVIITEGGEVITRVGMMMVMVMIADMDMEVIIVMARKLLDTGIMAIITTSVEDIDDISNIFIKSENNKDNQESFGDSNSSSESDGET